MMCENCLKKVQEMTTDQQAQLEEINRLVSEASMSYVECGALGIMAQTLLGHVADGLTPPVVDELIHRKVVTAFHLANHADAMLKEALQLAMKMSADGVIAEMLQMSLMVGLEEKPSRTH